MQARDDVIREYRAEHSARETAEHFGIAADTVRKACMRWNGKLICPYSPSCFSCPLDDCKIRGSIFANRLPTDEEYMTWE